MDSTPPRRVAAGVLVGALLLAATGAAGADRADAVQRAAQAGVPGEQTAFDVRADNRRAGAAGASAAQRRLRRALGAGALVASEPVTGGVRLVARRDGFLTGPSAERPREVALDYLRRRRAGFELDPGDISSLELSRSYRSESGAAHLWWEQTYRGIPAFDEGLRANVAADGRLINIGGAPRSDLKVASIEPRLGAAEAVRAAARGASTRASLGTIGPSLGAERETSFGAGHRAGLVLFGGARKVRLAWRVLLYADDGGPWSAIVDAESGELLWLASLVHNATARVHEYYPGAPGGGGQLPRTLDPSWLSSSTSLSGNNTYVYADLDANNLPGPGEDVPSVGGDWSFPADYRSASVGQTCPAAGCSWDFGSGSFTPAANQDQAGTQLFWFINRFHDHLRDASGIGFGPSSGSFEGGDRLDAQFNDGANPSPDSAHRNNAEIGVPRDGISPVMQMYLWCGSGCGAPYHDVNGADDAFIVYHEYTHGLSARLVTYPNGDPAVFGAQSGAMGEGWSDWYALDFLVANGFQPDSAAPGELVVGAYENASDFRTQAFDCPVGPAVAGCPGAVVAAAGPGGYTYGDFGKIIPGGPEVHADGEIWVGTLWDLRSSLIATHGPIEGVIRARALVTDGMRLSPASPTFLDMRNAILQADVNRGFRDCDRIWAAFAARGMGINARTTGDSDTAPVEDFVAPPPACLPPPPPPGDTTAPVIRGFSTDWRRFRVGLDRTPRSAQRGGGRAPVGSAFRFRLSERARVVITIERGLPGRRVGRRCRPATRRLRGRRRCTRYERKGSLTRKNRRRGRNVVRFSGRIGIKALKAGRHRATIVATDAAKNRSKRRRVSFTIVRR